MKKNGNLYQHKAIRYNQRQNRMVNKQNIKIIPIANSI